MNLRHLQHEVNFTLMHMKNLQKPPKTIKKSQSIGHEIDYKWNDKILSNLLDPTINNIHLDKTLNKIGHKASLGLTASLLEWVYWRFKGHSAMSDEIHQRIETLWFSIKNPKKAKPLDFDTDLNFPISGFINGPIWVALMNVRMIDVLNRKGSSLIQSELTGLVLTVRHLTPKKKTFDKWFEETISKLVVQFPNQNKQIEYSEDAFYDASSEPVICREYFFSSSFKYNPDSAKKALNNFISDIDYTTNTFCSMNKIN